MTTTNTSSTDIQHIPAFDRLAARLTQAATGRELDVAIVVLLTFGAVWWLFDIVSLWTFDVHPDVSELSVWARYISLGYKHPPLSGWMFAGWFAFFPRADAAADLLAVTTVVSTLAVIWRISRDYMDVNRTLLGIAALMLVPLFTFQAIKFNANLVMMPFWAAATLYFLRAHRSLRKSDALFAGIFAGLAFLGKYWTIYLLAGMGVASFMGPNARAFWKSAAPWLMALAAALVVAPHLWWLAFGNSTHTHEFVDRVMSTPSFGHDLQTSISYLVGCVAYLAVPLIFFACLRPSRATILDTLWPADHERRKALVFMTVPIILPALVNLFLPHRLTPVWTFPNWALLPVVLFGSPQLIVPALAPMRALLTAFTVGIGALIISPVLAVQHLSTTREPERLHWSQLAATIHKMDPDVLRYWGSAEVQDGLPFYLPGTRPISYPRAITDNTERVKKFGVAIVCRSADTACQAEADTFNSQAAWHEVTLTRRFLGFESPPSTYRIKVIPRAKS